MKPPSKLQLLFLRRYQRYRANSAGELSDLQDLRKKERALYTFPVAMVPFLIWVMREPEKQNGFWFFIGFMFQGMLFMLAELHWTSRAIDHLINRGLTSVEELMREAE